jgi:ribosomal protein S18 acetylase RimI-like enzyme
VACGGARCIKRSSHKDELDMTTTTATSDITIRPAKSAQEWQSTAIKWATDLQWSMGKRDAELFFNIDRDGCLLCTLADDGRPVGCISGVKYSDNMSFIGLYIMLPEYRGRGYGLRLFREAQRHLSGYKMGLDGVEAQIPNYQRSGFHPTRWNMTYRCVNPIKQGDTPALGDATTSIEVRDVATVSTAQWAAFERASVGFSRAANYYESLKAISFGVCAVDKKTNELVGICFARQSALMGYLVGPWYCRDQQVARRLLTAVLADRRMTGETITIEVPADNKDAVQLVESMGFKFVFKCNRMWTDDAKVVENMRTVYGHLSLALA